MTQGVFSTDLLLRCLDLQCPAAYNGVTVGVCVNVLSSPPIVPHLHLICFRKNSIYFLQLQQLTEATSVVCLCIYNHTESKEGFNILGNKLIFSLCIKYEARGSR